MTPSLAIRLDFGLHLAKEPATARAVAEILVRPCFVELERLSARWKDRWSRHTKPTVAKIAAYLLDPSVDAAYFDTKRARELVAFGEVENGIRTRQMMPSEVRHTVTIALPFAQSSLQELIGAVCDLAGVLRAAAGYVALEPKYGWAHEVALGGHRPRERVGLSVQRFRERRGRHWYEDRIGVELAGVEWGTFLGLGHLPKVDLDKLRRSGAFARVVEVHPALVYLQVTGNPLDDLSEGFEEKLAVARSALAPLLMDVSGVSIEPAN